MRQTDNIKTKKLDPASPLPNLDLLVQARMVELVDTLL